MLLAPFAIARPYQAPCVPERGIGHEPPVGPVRLATVILARCHVACVLGKVAATYAVVLANLSPGQPRKSSKICRRWHICFKSVSQACSRFRISSNAVWQT